MKYEIKGGNLPVVICTLQPGETMVTESGAMSWMSPNMKMETGAKGGLGGAFGRMFSGESIFKTATRRRRARADRLRLQLPRRDPRGGYRARPQHRRAKARLPCRLQRMAWSCPCSSRRNSARAFRRRGLHHAEALRQRHGVSGDRRLDGGIRSGARPVDDRRHGLPRRDGRHLHDGDRQRARASRTSCSAAKAVQHRRTRAGAHRLQSMPISAVASCLSPFFPSGSN